MTDPHANEMGQLLRDALRAPPDVTEVQSESGRRIQIVRNPEPGVELELRETDADGSASDFLSLTVSGAATRPFRYPSHVPFVAGVPAVVTVVNKMTTVAWQLAQDDNAEGPGLEAFQELEELMSPLKPITDRLQAADAGQQDELMEEARAAAGSLDESVLDKLRAAWEHLSRPDPSVVEELEEVFAIVSRASEAEGWERGDSTDNANPFQIRTVQFSRDEETRAISLMTMAGAASTVTLMQMRRDAGAAT